MTRYVGDAKSVGIPDVVGMPVSDVAMTGAVACTVSTVLCAKFVAKV
ncbi:hypothetical protein [Budvicia aquatica]|nr:hypothetical protein [Budvicia aquatica]